MNEQELQEELGILVKACQQSGAELAQHHIGALRAHLVCVSAMVRKLDRLEAEQLAEQQKAATPVADETSAPSVP
jgi:hypothetical protein